MKDLFKNTSFIEFKKIEKILRSKESLNEILNFHGENQKYTFDDYISNIDSYLYGFSILPPEDLNDLILWIHNYINYLYIPLVKNKSLYVLKCNFATNLIKDESLVNMKVKENLGEDFLLELKRIIFSRKQDILNEIDSTKLNKEIYLDNYHSIFDNIHI